MPRLRQRKRGGVAAGAPSQQQQQQQPDSRKRSNPAFAKSTKFTMASSASTQKEQPPAQKQKQQQRGSSSSPLLGNSFVFTRRVFLHLLGLMYFTAFLVAWHQNDGLIGPNGLTPAKTHMANLVRRYGGQGEGGDGGVGLDGSGFRAAFDGFVQRPTLLWFVSLEHTYTALHAITLAGVVLSAVVMVLGRANGVLLLLLWLLYFSVDTVGQRWYGFGWESQLLETGFLAAFSCPLLAFSSLGGARDSPPLGVVVWGNRWLMFRLMIGAGLIKLRGDQCWRDLTCMDYHYETQPVPSPMSWYLHFNVGWFHKLETMVNHIVECVVPFFIFMPRDWRVACGVIQVLFQVVLILSGNLSFLNWLSILPALWCLDDAFFRSIGLLSRRNADYLAALLAAPEEDDGGATTAAKRARSGPSAPARPPRRCRSVGRAGNKAARAVVSVGLLAGLTYLSLPVVSNLLQLTGRRQAMNTNYNSFKLLNTYGAFGSVGKERTEVILQGTRGDIHGPDPVEWFEYEFKCKPGDVDRVPCLITPYHYRLDWLMWFAAFSDYKTYPWLLHLADKLMVNDPLTSSLLAAGGNPFEGGEPPRFIRALHYSYKLTPPAGDGLVADLLHPGNATVAGVLSKWQRVAAGQALRAVQAAARAVGMELAERAPTSAPQAGPDAAAAAAAAGGEQVTATSPARAKLVAEGYELGRWWSRKHLGEYFPAVSRDNPSLQKFLRKHGWAVAAAAAE